MARCDAVKALFLGYLGSVAAAAHMAAAPRAFAELKQAMAARLEVIAAPLERLYKEETCPLQVARGPPPVRSGLVSHTELLEASRS